jgi:hypothetical protein
VIFVSRNELILEKNEEIFAKFPYFAWLFQKKVVSLQRILKA